MLSSKTVLFTLSIALGLSVVGLTVGLVYAWAYLPALNNYVKTECPVVACNITSN